MSHMPVNPSAPVQKRSGLSKWWPISFFIGAVVMFVVGGALIGTYLANASNCWDSYSYSSYYYDDYDYSCSSGHDGEFYGGVACFVIGGVCKLIAWILLIIFCVKRRRSINQTVATQYYTVPPTGQPQQPYNVPQPYGSQQPYPPPGAAPYPTHQPAQYPAQYPAHSPAASPGPNYANPVFQAPSAPASPPPKEAMASIHYA